MGSESGQDKPSNGDDQRSEVSPVLIGCLGKYLGESPRSSFDNLAEGFSATDTTGAPVNAKLTPVLEDLIKGDLPKTKLEGLVEKIPKTRKLLIASLRSKVNRAICNRLSPSKDDLCLQTLFLLFKCANHRKKETLCDSQ